ncbi:ABC transporter permease [Nonomuraea terrae]|uniref:Autoinducer 2 import system permease protein LsrC n=1 Tax=Nonomuraea terrae TaxID=2530383 RepID=A0A4R4ZAF5_9ACTN|nr:ABC transporter permease [Nonomuraea terrae]TDD54986.1 ABC transporter permease [Nonomuraea terrae]
MALQASERSAITPGPGFRLSRGLLTVSIAVILLFAVGAVLAPTSVDHSALLGMLPFAAVLAIAAVGQTLVVQQGGIDLSVPGAVSLAVVITTHQPAGDDDKLLGALVFGLAVAIGFGIVNGLLIGWRRLNPIVATLGVNALMYAVVLGISGGSPRRTTQLLREVAGGVTFGIPHSVYFGVVVVALAAMVMKTTVGGRRFEAIGANPAAAAATGLPVTRYRAAAYIWAQVLYWLAGVLLAGIIAQPTAFQGDAYLLPSVAAVVLGGTSLLGGRGFLVPTAIAAVFLSQLEQFVLALGVSFAIRTLVEAAALTVGVALYTVDWAAVRRRFAGRRTAATA